MSLQLLNESAVKRYIMRRVAETRGANFSGVSRRSLELLDAHLRAFINSKLPHIPARTKMVRFEDVL